MPHWRTNHETDSKHLRSSDLFDDQASQRAQRDTYASPIVEIVKMSVDVVKSKEKPRGERRNFAHFKGKSKPLGLNVTNCETLESLSGTSDPNLWVGLVIQLYVDPSSKYPSGKKGPAIRIRPTAPKGPVDTTPLADVPAETRDRLDHENAERLAREPGQEG
jgi:hypothetical protein